MRFPYPLLYFFPETYNMMLVDSKTVGKRKGMDIIMKENIISQTILNLRKKAGITQDELAAALHISAQAVSKWETDTCLPDTKILPLIAEYFNVSIDYLFYGEDVVYNEIYDKVQSKTASYPQMSKESYEDAHKLFAAAHHGISHGNLGGYTFICDKPSHISDFNGLSLLSAEGYGAIITRDFFTNITGATLDFSQPIFDVLSRPNVLAVISAIISMSDISISEITEKLALGDQEIQQALNEGISCGLIIEKISKHPALGKTYEIAGAYHTCLCIVLATMEMQRKSLEGILCCMGYGDYPITLFHSDFRPAGEKIL